MTAAALREHLGYWRDEHKIAAYRAALNEVVKPGDVVIDLGSGTGLLGMLAVEAGAGRVYAYDSGDILGIARDLAIINGLADRMEFRQEFTTLCELPPADVIVCDQIGGLAFDAGILEFFADAKERALKPNGRLLPASFELFLAPVGAPEPYLRIEDWDTRGGFDLTPARQLAVNSEHYVKAHQVTVCAPGARFASIASSSLEPITGACSWTIQTSHTMHGLAGWFDAEMSPSVRLTSDPERDDRMDRWLNFYPLARPVDLCAGDQVEATISIRPDSRRVTWEVVVNGSSCGRQSTFFGTFVFKKPTNKSENSPERVALLGQTIAMLAEGAEVTELQRVAQASGLFATKKAADRFVDKLQHLAGMGPGAK